jgi:hypothetical protein
MHSVLLNFNTFESQIGSSGLAMGSSLSPSLNNFDHRLSFKIDKMENNQIKYLDFLIFIENSKIKFRDIFKKGLDTVYTNYQHDISPLKYKHNIFTQLHRTRDCCSDTEQFEKSLDDLRIIFSRNSHRAKNQNIFTKR